MTAAEQRALPGARAEKKKYDAAYRIVNRDRLLAYQRNYNHVHRLERLAYHVAYVAANREKHLTRRRAYNHAHRVERVAKQTAWQRANPDKRGAIVARRRARKLGAAGSFTADEWNILGWSVGWHCMYCDLRLTPRTAIREHKIPLFRGGSNHIENIAVACVACNSRKGTRTDTEFLEQVRAEGLA